MLNVMYISIPKPPFFFCKGTSPSRARTLQPGSARAQRPSFGSHPLHGKRLSWSWYFQGFKGSSCSMGFPTLHVVSTEIQRGRERPSSRRLWGWSQAPFTSPAAFGMASAALGTSSVRTAVTQNQAPLAS